METLPEELRSEVVSHLPHVDILSLSQTCRSFAAVAKPFLFETLRLHGDAEGTRQHMLYRYQCDRMCPGRSKEVDLALLEHAINEVMELGIHRYATTFQYSPKHYVDNFWPMYRNWIEEQILGGLDMLHNPDSISDAWDDYDMLSYVGMRRIVDARQARPEKEREVTAKAEVYWNAKVSEQEQKKDANYAALVRLFRGMSALNRIQIMEWTCERELRKHGIVDELDHKVGEQFSGSIKDRVNLHLQTLSRALQESGARIKHLLLPSISSRSTISRSPAVQHLFSGLTSLSFTLLDPTEMQGDYHGPLPSFGKLIQCARHTLEKLEFSNWFESQPYYPEMGEHVLEKLWGHEPGSDNDPLVFPKLKTFILISLIVYTPSLISFLHNQPALEKALFEYVFLPTQGYSWSDVAAALPPSCTALHISKCGGDATPSGSPASAPRSDDVSYNHIPHLLPYKQAFPASSGWRASETYFDREVLNDMRIATQVRGGYYFARKECLALNIAAAERGDESYRGTSLEQLRRDEIMLGIEIAAETQRIREIKRSTEVADYERIWDAQGNLIPAPIYHEPPPRPASPMMPAPASPTSSTGAVLSDSFSQSDTAFSSPSS